MDFPVEATIHLGYFKNEGEAVKILRSHKFAIEDSGTSEVRVKGLFLSLKWAKADLEQLLEAQRQTGAYSSPHHAASSGAVPKTHYTAGSGGDGSRSGSRHKPPPAAVSSPNSSSSPQSETPRYHPGSPQHRAPLSPAQRGSVRPRHETLAVEGDVFMYAQKVRGEDLGRVFQGHNIELTSTRVGESFHITLKGGDAKMVADELQRFLNGLHASLRTQEVPREDMGPQGEIVLRRVRENGGVHRFVLVREMSNRLHLIGPSAESYELKQRLLGKSADRAGHTGRTSDRGPRRRSSSLPACRDRGGGDAGRQPSPVRGARRSTGDDKQEAAEPEPSRKQSQCVSAENKPAGSRIGNRQETDSKPKDAMKWLKSLFNTRIKR